MERSFLLLYLLRLLDNQSAGDGLSVAGEYHGVESCGQPVGADGVDDCSCGVQGAGVHGAAEVVDNGYAVVTSVAQVDADVSLCGGRVGVELAEG